MLLRGWVPTEKLREGDSVRRADGRYGVVTAVARVAQPQPLVNLSVAEAHTFFVGEAGWLVHNAIKWPKGGLALGLTRLGALAQWAGRNDACTLFESKIVSDPVGTGLNDWTKFLPDRLNHAAQAGVQVHFHLDDMVDIPDIRNNCGLYANKYTSIELRYIRDNWDRFNPKPLFYRGGRQTNRPF